MWIYKAINKVILWNQRSSWQRRPIASAMRWTGWKVWRHPGFLYVSSYSMTQVQVWPSLTAARAVSRPRSLPASLTHPLYILSTLNLSVILPISPPPLVSSPFRCLSSFHSPPTHLSFSRSISTDHSVLLALLMTASIDLHLLPVLPLSVESHFPAYSTNSLSSLLHHCTSSILLFLITSFFISKCLPVSPHPSRTPPSLPPRL